MDIDEFAKLIFYIGVTASIVGVSYQFARLLGAVRDNVVDLRTTVKNAGILVEGLVKNQEQITGGIDSAVKAAQKLEMTADEVNKQIVIPVRSLGSSLRRLSKAAKFLLSRIGIL